MQSIYYWIKKRAEITPSRKALIGNREKLTYAEMNKRTQQYALNLQANYSIKKGDRIGILSTNNVEFVILLFAIAKLNAIAVPLNVRLSVDELSYQINDSGLETLVVVEDLWTVGEKLNSRTNISHLLTFTDLAADQPKTSTIQEYKADPQAPYIICYTSGTTGKPKGAVLTQENMYWNALNNITAIDITSEDKTLVLLPIFHIGGIGLFTFPVLLAGGTAVIPDRFDPEQSLHLIEKHNITLVMGVPTIHDAIRKAPNFKTTNLTSIRWFYSGGAPCPEELIRFYLDRGVPFGQGFGMTETSPTVFMLVKEDYQRKIGSIGKPAMFNDIRVVDHHGKDVPTGEVGELLIKGPNVFKEYWNLPEVTANALKDGWFATGDLVSQDEEGFVYIAGRKKEMLISGGENIYPLEIEKVLYELPDVEEAAVIGAPHEKWGEVPIAVIAPKTIGAITEKDVKRHCQQRLARYKVPAKFIFVESLPKNATGKIDKPALARTYGTPKQEVN
ncbi:MAG: o-succinylbenzoate--CoA ligase [Bacillus sp. (in: Bacteria)]|nr:o-succinylbenzoate--CoA ligase [Bacillus sp. (in: firmicutes)]